MRILIAYDGSEYSDAAIVDLRRAGLPPAAEALVLSVAEISPRVEPMPIGVQLAGPGAFLAEDTEREASVEYQVQQARALAIQAADRLRADFPGWHINTADWADAAASAIIREAHAWKPDLIVLGSHGRCGISRLLLGSVSARVLHHVSCSVRVSRHHLHSQERSIRVLIGVDGSENARIAVQAVGAGMASTHRSSRRGSA